MRLFEHRLVHVESRLLARFAHTNLLFGKQMCDHELHLKRECVDILANKLHRQVANISHGELQTGQFQVALQVDNKKGIMI